MVGTPGATSLVDYGIQTEESDLRVHVCVNAARAYVYPTRYGIEAIRSGKYPLKGAAQPGVNYDTAAGYLVPPHEIYGCLPVRIEWALQQVGDFSYSLSTSEKGNKAVQVVSLLLSKGFFPMWAAPDVVNDLDLQFKGTDILVRQTVRIQVKCDYEGGAPRRLPWGPKGTNVTGNLYLQVAESNPLRHY